LASRAAGAEARTARALRHAPNPRACRQPAIGPRFGIALLAACLALIQPDGSAAQEVPDVVARDVLRVCADPHNMPFSNRKGQGFENRIAEILADELKVPLRYYWLAQGPGFIANTLGSKLCDVVMGYAAGADPVQHTNPYYRSVYVLLIKPGAGLDGLDRLSDPRLRGKRLGVIAATPPADHLLEEGLLATAKSYALLVDRSTETPAEDMIADLVAGRIDGALLWGPIGGDLARRSSEPLTVIPLLHERERPPLSYRITFGIRHNEQDWKRGLNQAIRKRQVDFDRVLIDFGVPLLDDDDRLIGAPRNAAK
jgi:quinoprotein dehydrogenase-associated probable ABC transporter substrate-binding protein